MGYLSIVAFVLAYLLMGGQENTGASLPFWIYPTVLSLVGLGTYCGHRALTRPKKPDTYVMSENWLKEHGTDGMD